MQPGFIKGSSPYIRYREGIGGYGSSDFYIIFQHQLTRLLGQSIQDNDFTISLTKSREISRTSYFCTPKIIKHLFRIMKSKILLVLFSVPLLSLAQQLTAGPDTVVVKNPSHPNE